MLMRFRLESMLSYAPMLLLLKYFSWGTFCEERRVVNYASASRWSSITTQQKYQNDACLLPFLQNITFSPKLDRSRTANMTKNKLSFIVYILYVKKKLSSIYG